MQLTWLMMIIIVFENSAGRLDFLLIFFMVQLNFKDCVLLFLGSYLLFCFS